MKSFKSILRSLACILIIIATYTSALDTMDKGPIDKSGYQMTTETKKEVNAQGKCPGPEWAAYRNEKCFKILNTKSKTQTLAKDECKNLADVSKSTLVSLNVFEEEAFLHDLLIKSSHQNYNIWLGLERVNETSYFAWQNGQYLSSYSYTNWASGHPTEDGSKKCVEIRSNNNNNNNAMSSDTSAMEPQSGLWYNVPCTNKYIVVCQTYQPKTL